MLVECLLGGGQHPAVLQDEKLGGKQESEMPAVNIHF